MEGSVEVSCCAAVMIALLELLVQDVDYDYLHSDMAVGVGRISG